MLGAIYIGLSGMDAYSKGLQTIGNNVANLNSIGYKSTSVSFADMYSYLGGGYSSFNGANSNGSGTGVRFGHSRIDFQQGELRQTANDLDLAIQGGGFLMLMNGDTTAYGRTGQFSVNEDGFITLDGTNYHLATLDASGQPVEVNIGSARTSAAIATSRINFSGNLRPDAVTASSSPYTVFDSNGVKHTWTTKFEPVGVTGPDQWTVTVTDENGATVGTSTLKFIGGIVDPSASSLTITTTPAGASTMTVTLDFSGAMTSNASSGTTSAVQASVVDGRVSGELSTVKINEDGQVELSYTNEDTKEMGSVALADFLDPELLERSGGGLFRNTAGAQYRVLASGADGVGNVIGGSIESSNVDLTAQFGDLILVQRGFQASSQVVSVSNDMIQQLFGIRGQG